MVLKRTDWYWQLKFTAAAVGVNLLVAHDCLYVTKILYRPEMLCAASSPMAEVTDGGLKFLNVLIWQCKCLDMMSSAGILLVGEPGWLVLVKSSVFWG